MTERYKLGTLAQVEDLQQKARIPYLAAYVIKYPGSTTRVQEDYINRITKNPEDTTIQLSTDGKLADHADRFDDPIKHPDHPDHGGVTDKALLLYDDAKEGDDMETAYYYNPTAATALGANPAITDISRAEAEALGFFPEIE